METVLLLIALVYIWSLEIRLSNRKEDLRDFIRFQWSKNRIDDIQFAQRKRKAIEDRLYNIEEELDIYSDEPEAPAERSVVINDNDEPF